MSEVVFIRDSFGFRHMKTITTSRHEEIHISESSAAWKPHIWLWVDNRKSVYMNPKLHLHATGHLTLEEASLLRDQLTWLIENHYDRKCVNES